MTRYTRALAAALRRRGATEGQVTDVVREVHGLGLDDAALVEELGRPDEYALQVLPEERHVVRVVDLLVPLGAVAALAWTVVVLVAGLRGWDLYDALGPLRLVPGVLLAAGGFVVRRVVDRRPVRR